MHNNHVDIIEVVVVEKAEETKNCPFSNAFEEKGLLRRETFTVAAYTPNAPAAHAETAERAAVRRYVAASAAVSDAATARSPSREPFVRRRSVQRRMSPSKAVWSY